MAGKRYLETICVNAVFPKRPILLIFEAEFAESVLDPLNKH